MLRFCSSLSVARWALLASLGLSALSSLVPAPARACSCGGGAVLVAPDKDETGVARMPNILVSYDYVEEKDVLVSLRALARARVPRVHRSPSSPPRFVGECRARDPRSVRNVESAWGLDPYAIDAAL